MWVGSWQVSLYWASEYAEQNMGQGRQTKHSCAGVMCVLAMLLWLPIERPWYYNQPGMTFRESTLQGDQKNTRGTWSPYRHTGFSTIYTQTGITLESQSCRVITRGPEDLPTHVSRILHQIKSHASILLYSFMWHPRTLLINMMLQYVSWIYSEEWCVDDQQHGSIHTYRLCAHLILLFVPVSTLRVDGLGVGGGLD